MVWLLAPAAGKALIAAWSMTKSRSSPEAAYVCAPQAGSTNSLAKKLGNPGALGAKFLQ